MEPVAEEDLYLYCYAAGTQFKEVFGLKMIHYAYCSLMIKYNLVHVDNMNGLMHDSTSVSPTQVP